MSGKDVSRALSRLTAGGMDDFVGRRNEVVESLMTCLLGVVESSSLTSLQNVQKERIEFCGRGGSF